MDYLQYLAIKENQDKLIDKVLNLIINGLPSIHDTLIKRETGRLQF